MIGGDEFILSNFMPVSSLLEKVSGEKKRGNEFYQIELVYSQLKNEMVITLLLTLIRSTNKNKETHRKRCVFFAPK